MKKESFEKRVNACFKGNDVRCLYEKELDEELAYEIGAAIVHYLQCRKIIVAQDMRFSSPILKKALIEGIINRGCDVVDIGMIDTPGLYFATSFLQLPGVSITASHNPIEYNGIKIVKENAVPVGMGSGLEKIKEIVLKKNSSKKNKKGIVIEKNILSEYKKHVLSFIDINKLEKVKVVVDAGNSIAGKIVPFIYDALPLHLVKMYFEITGYFEHHEANPLKEENIKDLQKKVLEEKADMGIAFDGDMDRVFFIDEKAQAIESSQIALLIMNYFLPHIQKEGFVYSLVMSKSLHDMAQEKRLLAYK